MRTAQITRSEHLDYVGTEAMNTICTNLSFAGRDLHKIVVTSCTPDEGKSTTVMRIATNLAKRGSRVCIVDADLRASVFVERYGMETAGELVGLAQYLAGHCRLDDAVYQTNLNGLCVIPAGRDVANPIPLLTSAYFGDMLDQLAGQFDTVLVDAPPLGVVVDAAEIARYCDGTVLICKYNTTRRRELRDAKQQMEQSGAEILGVILNMVTFDSLSAKKYYNGSYYSHYNKGYYRGYGNQSKEEDEK